MIESELFSGTVCKRDGRPVPYDSIKFSRLTPYHSVHEKQADDRWKQTDCYENIIGENSKKEIAFSQKIIPIFC